MDIGLTPIAEPQCPVRAQCRHLRHDGRRIGPEPSPPPWRIPAGRSSISRVTSAIGFSGMEMETLVR